MSLTIRPRNSKKGARLSGRRRAGVIVLVAGAILLVLLGLFLTGRFPQEPLRRALESRLRQGLGAGSSIGSVHIVPGRLQVELRDVVLVGPTYRLVAPRLFLVAKMDFLLGRSLAFRVVQADAPHLTLTPSPTAQPKKPLLAQPLVIDMLELSDAVIEYEGTGDVGELVLRGVDARGSIGHGTLEIALDGGAWTRAADPLGLRDGHGILRVSSNLDITIDALDMRTARSRVHTSGRLGVLGMLAPDLQLDATLDLREAAHFRPEPRMSGTVAVKGRLKYSDRVTLDAHVQGQALRVDRWAIDRVSGSVKHGVEGADRTRVDLVAGLLGGRADVDATLRGSRADGRLRFAGIDIGALRRQGIDIGFVDAGQIGGTVTGGGDLAGTLGVRAQLQGAGRGAGFRLSARGSAEGDVEVRRRRIDLDWRATLSATPARGAGAGALRLASAEITARGSAEGAMPPAVSAKFDGAATMLTERGRERVPLSGSLRYRSRVLTADVGAKGLGGSMQASLEMRGAVVRRLDATARQIELASLLRDASGRVDARIEARGPWKALSGSGTVQASSLVWRQVAVGDASARFTARNGVADVSFAAPGFNATGSGTATASGFRGTVLLADTALERLQPFLSPQRPLAGVVSGTVNVDLAWRAPERALVAARLDRAEVVSGTLNARARRPFALTLRGRRVEVAGLDVEGPGMDFTADGLLSLDPGGPLDLRLRGQMDLARVPPPQGWTLQGVATGDVRLTGTRTRPRAHGLIALRSGLIQRPGAQPIQVADGDVLLEGDVARARNLRVTMGGSHLELTGLIPLTAVLGEETVRRLGLSPTLPTQLVARLDVDLADVPLPFPWSATGRLRGEAVISGTLTRPRANGEVFVVDAILFRAEVPVASVPSGRMFLAGDAVDIPPVEAQVAEGSAALSGRVPLAALLGGTRAERFHLSAGEASLKLAWRDIELASVYEILRPEEISPLNATLAGEAAVEGQFTGWQNVRGSLRTEPTTLSVESERVAVDPVTMTLRAGRLTTSGLTLSVADTVFRADGEADLVRRTVAAHAEGRLDLRALSPFIESFTISGPAQIDVDLAGPLTNPRPRGTVTMAGATLRVRDMPIVLTSMKARVALEETAIRISDASALLGGGTITLGGGAALDGLRPRDVRVDITARDVALRYPVGGKTGSRVWDELKARADADLTLTGNPGNLLLAGTVTAERALYDADMFLEEAFLPPQAPPDTGPPSRIRRAVAVNITVLMENPLVVRNNLAELQAGGTLNVRGDLAEPAPFGRLEAHPGGKIFLQGREFNLVSGSFVYRGTMDPEIHIVATTVVGQTTGDIEVTVSASGHLREPRLTLTSVPPYSEKELASLIVTGRPDVTLDASTAVLGRHAASLLAGRFTRQVARQLMALGFDQVDIQPELLAREGDPRARFVFAKQVSRNLRLIYALGLNDPEARYYQAQFRFRPGREVTLKAQRAESGSYTYSAGQRLRLGKGGQVTRFEEERTRLSAVRIVDETAVPEREILSWVDARAGDRVTFWDLVDDADRIQEKLVDMGYIEALADAHLHEDAAEFHVTTGPRYAWRVEGMDGPPDLGGVIREAVYEEEALERGRERLLEELHARGFLRAEVLTATQREPNQRTLVFTARPGPSLDVAEVRFPGASVFSASDLAESAGGAAVMVNSPQLAQERVRDLYRQNHYLRTKVSTPEIVESGGRLAIAMAVEEGPQAVLAEVITEGSSIPPQNLRKLIRIHAGERYDPTTAAETVLRLRDLYLKLGYPSARVTTALNAVGPNLQLVFRVHEGERVYIGDIVVKGLRRTRESLIRKQVHFKRGDLLDTRRLAEVERRIIDLGLFSRAVVTASDTSPATVTIEVEEQPRYLAAYDLRYNPEEGASALVDAEMDNLFGRGWSIGGRHRRGRDLDETRASFHVPAFFRAANLTLSVFQARDDRITAQDRLRAQEFGLPLEGGRMREQGFAIQQASRQLEPWELLYGYRFRRVRTQAPLETEWTTQDVGGIDVGAVLDTRDTALAAARRGLFLSLNLELAPKVLGSDLNFLKGFGTFTLTTPLSRSLTWAQGYRIGLGKAYGGRLASFERFTAGGANSVRGYGTDSLGPLDEQSRRGGDAVVVLNQELRWEAFEGIGLGAAVFYDAGNVFRSLSDFGLDLRHSLGVGLRYDSPVGLLRLDVGLPLDRREENGRIVDKGYQIWFALGQAF